VNNNRETPLIFPICQNYGIYRRQLINSESPNRPWKRKERVSLFAILWMVAEAIREQRDRKIGICMKYLRRILTAFSRERHLFPTCRSFFPFIFIRLYYMILFRAHSRIAGILIFSWIAIFAHGRVRIYYTIRSEIARGEFDLSSPFSSPFQTLRWPFPIVSPFFFMLRTPYTFHCGLAVYRARARMYGDAKYCGEYGPAPFIICRWFASV